MQFVVKRDVLLKSLNFVQGVVEKKNTLPILSNVLIQLKDKKLSIIATDLDIIFQDEISEIKVLEPKIGDLVLSYQDTTVTNNEVEKKTGILYEIEKVYGKPTDCTILSGDEMIRVKYKDLIVIQKK